MPLGRRATIDAKIISEMPLPMPCWVMSSPSHITRTQPVVSTMTIMKSEPTLKLSMIAWPAAGWNERKRKT